MHCMILFFTVLSFIIENNLHSEFQVSYFYDVTEENADNYTEHEKMLVAHTNNSFQKAVNHVSALNTCSQFIINTQINGLYGVIPYYHLANNLNSLPSASHLHIGLYTGGSFIGALYGNQNSLISAIGIDWFQEDWGYKKIFFDSCALFLNDSHDPYTYQIVQKDCFAVDKAIFTSPINVYIYDADHTQIAHEKAFTYYNDVFDDVFIAIVDDWEWEVVRLGTFTAFNQLEYVVLYQNIIPAAERCGNGQYVAVIRKQTK